MNLIAGYSDVMLCQLCLRLAHRLVVIQYRINGQQTQASNCVRRPLNTIGIGNRLTEHLIAPAQTKHPATPAVMRQNIDIPPICA